MQVYLLTLYSFDPFLFWYIYPSTVPLISKSWGISIVITSACNGTVPYAIFVIDRVFGCLLGTLYYIHDRR